MSYDEPFKLRVINALADALKEITPGNGYTVDLADFDPGDGVDTERVIVGRAWFGDNDPIPMVGILEGIDPAAEVQEPPADTATGEYDWHVLLQGWINPDPADLTHTTKNAYRMLADVRRRLSIEKIRKQVNDPTERDPFGLKSAGPSVNQITSMSIGSGVVRPADDVSSTSWFWLSLTLRIVDKGLQPYD